jgi:hypothetical protein
MNYPPLLVRFRMRGYHMPRLRLWIPLFLIWPLAAALFLLLSPFFLLVLAAGFIFFSVRLNPFELMGRLYELVCSLRGMSVDVEIPVEGNHIEIEFK